MSPRYKKAVELLAAKPDRTMIIGYFKPVEWPAADLAKRVGVEVGTIYKYVKKMQREGYDVRQNAYGEYYLHPAENYSGEFEVQVGTERASSEELDILMVKVTHNGRQWSSLELGNIEELRLVHDSIGQCIKSLARANPKEKLSKKAGENQ